MKHNLIPRDYGQARPLRVPGDVSSWLTVEDVREFQRLLHEHCGIVLDEAEASVRANELVMLYRALLGPIPEDSEIPPDSEGSNIRALARFAQRKLP